MAVEKRTTGQRVGLKGYLSLVARVRRSPATVEQISQFLGVTQNRAGGIIRSLRAVGVVRVAGWTDAANLWSAMRPLFGFGGEPDAPHPHGTGRPAGKPHKSINATAISVKALLRATAEIASKAEIAQETGFTQPIINGIMNHMHDIGLARIAGWTPGLRGGPPTALYIFGNGPSVARPAPEHRSVSAARSQKAKREKAMTLDLIRRTASANADQALEAA